VADASPIAGNACTLEVEGSLNQLDGYTDVMLGRVGLMRLEPWSAGDTPGALTARVAVVPLAPAQ
jgi:hypothetical protein